MKDRGAESQGHASRSCCAVRGDGVGLAAAFLLSKRFLVTVS
jgi:hypothetical protein